MSQHPDKRVTNSGDISQHRILGSQAVTGDQMTTATSHRY